MGHSDVAHVFFIIFLSFAKKTAKDNGFEK